MIYHLSNYLFIYFYQSIYFYLSLLRAATATSCWRVSSMYIYYLSNYLFIYFYQSIYFYFRPTSCSYCYKLLKGLFFQGYRCETCNRSMHKETISSIKIWDKWECQKVLCLVAGGLVHGRIFQYFSLSFRQKFIKEFIPIVRITITRKKCARAHSLLDTYAHFDSCLHLVMFWEFFWVGNCG